MSEIAPQQLRKSLAFRAIDSIADAHRLIDFGRDLYRASLGDDAAFFRDYGSDGARFPAWVGSCAARAPDLAVFLEGAGETFGMAVASGDPRDQSLGRVHHLYVAEPFRGFGYGGLLDEHMRSALRRAGYERARLNVAAGNSRARRFYEALGWTEISSRGRRNALRYYRIDL